MPDLIDLNMLDFLQTQYPLMTESETRLANVILSAPEKIPGLSINALAQLTQVSTPTITRFCRKMGCPSFADFKLQIGIALTGNPARTHDSTHQLWRGMINACESQKDEGALQMATAKLVAARRILLFGLGSSGLSALEFKSRLSRLGLTADAIIDPHQMLMLAALIQADDVLVCLSNSGESIELNEAASHARKQGAWILSISNHFHTTLARTSDLLLPTPSRERAQVPDNFVNSQLGILYLMDELTSRLFQQEHCRLAYQKTLKIYHKKTY
ncbi:MurR/RpiR family transcriptional regulator [Iodobacter ciconiae]|uniref:MurR/RpiR family transcriptional regulator n=1 Tax=Iodobacter ciconiae TaxID=2496266 RepID=A0A3S8ZQY8_9NEIS|nr:MurR/RpiR family transcriptional regulator [Iodobacter ciconiae]AZN35887.1 MurR/RpiR family transcriptional regulator [Iodobacter ciconiae]